MFVKGISGNPSGRPKGAKNKSSFDAVITDCLQLPKVDQLQLIAELTRNLLAK